MPHSQVLDQAVSPQTKKNRSHPSHWTCKHLGFICLMRLNITSIRFTDNTMKREDSVICQRLCN